MGEKQLKQIGVNYTDKLNFEICAYFRCKA